MYQPKILYIDLETSPNEGLFWRTGHKLYVDPNAIVVERKIICASWKWRGEDYVYNVTWDAKAEPITFTVDDCEYKSFKLGFDDRSLLEEVIPVINEADLIVYQNGDRFDLPWLKARALIQRLPMNPRYPTFDTLKKSRSNFYFNSHRLDYVQQLVGGSGKIATGFDLWKKIQLNNDQDALAHMVEYCNKDVVDLEEWHTRIEPYVTPNTHVGVIKGFDKWTCPYCGTHEVHRNREYCTAGGTIRHSMKCSEGHTYPISDALYRKYLKERDK